MLVLYAWLSMLASSMTYIPNSSHRSYSTLAFGVVAGTHGGDVVAAHRLQVLTDVVGVDGLAAIRVVIVAVDTEDPDRLAVDEQFAVCTSTRRRPMRCVDVSTRISSGLSNSHVIGRGWVPRPTTPHDGTVHCASTVCPVKTQEPANTCGTSVMLEGLPTTVTLGVRKVVRTVHPGSGFVSNANLR